MRCFGDSINHSVIFTLGEKSLRACSVDRIENEKKLRKWVQILLLSKIQTTLQTLRQTHWYTDKLV